MGLSEQNDAHTGPEALFNPSKVDLVSTPAGGATVELHILNDTGWTGSSAVILSLQAKINAYLAFALDGQMASLYPEFDGKPWRIVIRDQAGPTGSTLASVVERFAAEVRRYGGELVYIDAIGETGGP